MSCEIPAANGFSGSAFAQLPLSFSFRDAASTAARLSKGPGAPSLRRSKSDYPKPNARWRALSRTQPRRSLARHRQTRTRRHKVRRLDTWFHVGVPGRCGRTWLSPVVDRVTRIVSTTPERYRAGPALFPLGVLRHVTPRPPLVKGKRVTRLSPTRREEVRTHVCRSR